ncbi:single-stranded-DNA-specific exonuclease [Thiomicrorhabdus immobilis]|uniref:Single-stranded-DNA-specific exonuclease RecJ n=1 Tax=Thiomicrorhabdus immobilis TaxID=2791037 RepID=A0ABM7MDE0_9GAMM|nr:DHH family phosphoesterase [Thiomicrorhabdus immobilis]BCN93404.1 single-stranded-DNA-specific exonuclease [Thiomicrorhabdus immobilis]
MIKHPKIVHRTPSQEVYDTAKQLGLSDFQARLVANRTDQTEQLDEIVFPKLKHIQHPSALKNIEEAAQIIVKAIQSDGAIVLATDYDTDGVTSAWVATTALCDYFNVAKSRIVHVIGDRKTGYGITDDVVKRILSIEQPIDLVISADQGSSDEDRIAVLKSHGIDVCVTDHHQIPVSGVPQSAICTVNPQQSGCEYDKTIAGCFVIFLVMTQVRQTLIKQGLLEKDSPSLKYLALNVALGTVADSVSLKSPNNRAIVYAGLQLINLFQSPAWQALRQLNDNQGMPFDAEFLGFQVATRINAASRVSDVTTAFKFLTAGNVNDAMSYLQQLDEDNQNRRAQQEIMLQQAHQQAQQRYTDTTYSMTLKLNGNAGIQGIIASRIGEQYGVPTVAMTDLEDGTLAGSARGIVPDIDLREAFQWMSEQKNDLFLSMGGHKGAAGCMIPLEFYDEFSHLFEQAIQLQLGDSAPVPIIETDGELDDWLLTPNLIDEINALEPFGREWPKPMFSGEFTIVQIREVGQQKTHLSCKLKTPSGTVFQAIYFNAKQSENDPTPFVTGEVVVCAYQPALNNFAGRTSLQLRISAMTSIE